MTKRKAIEAALRQWIKARNSFTAVDVADVIVGEAIEHAYDAGRIAGLREAAIIAGNRHASIGDWVAQASGSERAIRDHANKLAKKASVK